MYRATESTFDLLGVDECFACGRLAPQTTMQPTTLPTYETGLLCPECARTIADRERAYYGPNAVFARNAAARRQTAAVR
jgi:hypothetical protein